MIAVADNAYLDEVWTAMMTVGELSLSDLPDQNRRVQSKINSVMSQLGTGVAFVRVPVWFVSYPYPDGTLTARAFTPNLANLQVVNGNVIFPSQFGPKKTPTAVANVFEDYMQMNAASLTNGGRVYFVDDWDTYHRNHGDVHCGTTVKRKKFDTNWWDQQ